MTLSEAFDVQQTTARNNQLLLFSSRQLACMMAQITDGDAWRLAEIRNQNGFEICGRLRRQFAVPKRARATSLLNEIFSFKLRQHDQQQSDLSDFIRLPG